MASNPFNLSQLMTLLALQTEARRQAQAQALSVATQQVYALDQGSTATPTGAAALYSQYNEISNWYSPPQITTWASDTANLIDPILQVLATNTDAYLAQMITEIWLYGDPGGYLERGGEHLGESIERIFVHEAETFVDDAGHLVDEAGHHLLTESGHLVDEAGHEVIDQLHHDIGELAGDIDHPRLSEHGHLITRSGRHILSERGNLIDRNGHEVIEPARGSERLFRPVGSVPTGDALREGGITHAGAYGRVADTYRYQQSLLDQAGKAIATDEHPKPPTLQSPLDAAVQRAQSVANTDVALTMRKQSQATLQGAEKQGIVVGYRRILHPELDKYGACGLCIAASTRIYKTDHLMALHHDCECQVLPVTREHDPGGVINDRDLGLLYQAAGGDTREQLKHTQFEVRQHGELGPVLVAKGAPFRTPAMVKRATARPGRGGSEARRRRQLTSLRDALARSLQRIDNELYPADPNTWHEYRASLIDRVNSLNAQLKGGRR